MRRFVESAFFFRCSGEELPGIVTLPNTEVSTGVLIVVGGPQYRVGSHRQFVQLARGFAGAGLACMRFDCRGMGDATGDERSFDELGDDIDAAIGAFRGKVASLQRIVLLGLCDGATAAVLCAAQQRTLAGLVLINPWVRTEVGASRTFLRHYYARRFLDRSLWRKLASGQLGVRDALRRFFKNARTSMESAYAAAFKGTGRELPERVCEALGQLSCNCVVLLSGRDFVAREFEDSMRQLPSFLALVERGRVLIRRADSADHTFSGQDQVAELLAACLEAVGSMTPKTMERGTYGPQGRVA